jgi:2-oxoglutarate dehydrogenase E2 component (dihydrolipoamide succinyltransferase)
MALVDLIMPKLGESIMEATILKWHKQVGDKVSMDETVLDIATDKVDSEVPSTAAGTLAEILFAVNDVVPIGAVIARIDTGGGTEVPAKIELSEPIVVPPPPPPTVETAPLPEPVVPVVEPTPSVAEIPYVPSPIQMEELPSGKTGVNRFYSPLVLNIAQREGISMSELEQIPGTGHEYRVTKKDILQYVADKKAGKIAAPIPLAAPVSSTVTAAEKSEVSQPENIIEAAAPALTEAEAIPAQEPVVPVNSDLIAVQLPAAPRLPEEIVAPPVIQAVPLEKTVQAAPARPMPEEPSKNGKWSDPAKVIVSGETEIQEMDRMRKLISKHMVNSVQTSPHVTSFTEADVTNMVFWRQRVKDEFEKREGTRLTFTPLFIECIVNAMKRFPLINCSVNGEQIILRKDINIGMATALPSGNLIVPVIKGADQLNVVGLSRAVNQLSDAARNNQLKPDDTTGGTFTFTNVGTFGSLMGTPIINQPQVAILAAGAIKKRPMVMETAEGDVIAVRHMMYLSLSYDHRIIDGSMGASFLTEVAKEMERWDVNKRWYQYL